MTDEKTLQQIANQLLPKYRLFLVTGQGGDELTKQERDMLDKIRDNAGNAELEELQPYVNRSTSETMVASRAYGFLATILNEYQQGVRETYWGADAPRKKVSITSPGASFVPEEQKPPQATTLAERIAGYLPEPYRSHFLARSRNLEEVQNQFPDASAINETDRDFIYAARLLVDTDGSRSQIFDYLAPYIGERRIAEDDNVAILRQQELIEEFRRVVAAPAPGREEIRTADPLGRTPEEGGFGRPFTPTPETAAATQREFGTGAEDIEPGEAARLGAATGMVGQTIIEDGQVTRVFGPGGTAGVGDAGGAGDTGTGDTDTGDGTGGVVVDGVTVETPYDDSIPEDWKQAASEIYGAYYSIISQNREVADLIARAEAEKWGPEKFDYELEQTGWWKTTSLATRTFDIEMGRDPATVQARIDALAAQIREDALELNIRLSGETLNTIATEAIRQGWTEQQVTIALGDEAVKSQAGVTGLRYGYYGNKINEIAASYGVSVSDLEFSQLVEKFALGRENEESLTSAFQTRATALFPALSERLMAGETFSDIVEPYRNRASKILEQDFSASDFMDNDSFAQAVTYIGDDGKQRPMTYTEWGQYLRSNREFGYEYTSEAQSRAYQVANRIADIFGAI